jgi:transcriptional regulator with XRE-family HTH domain
MTPLAKRLKQARKKANISQEKLGIITGIDEFSASARMNQYETGKRTPNYSTMERIAETLGYPVEFFYTQDDFIAEILCLLYDVSVAGKIKILGLIKDMKIDYLEAPAKQS